jgi:hypothetical protein
MCNRSMKKASWILGFMLSLAVPALADTNTEARAVSVLVNHFETVFRVKGNLLTGAGAYEGMSESVAGELRFPYLLLSSGLDFLGPKTAAKIASSSESVLVGAKDFRPPGGDGLGGVSSKRCYVFVLSSGSGFDSNKYFRAKATAASGDSTWSWTTSVGELGEGDPRPSSFYATQISRSYLLVSNNLEDLRDVRVALNGTDNTSAALGSLPEWQLLLTHDIWAYRRYRFVAPAGIDPGQDGWKRVSGMEDVLPGTEALFLWVDSHEHRANLHLVDKSKEARTAGLINGRGGLPPLKQTGAGVWEAVILLADNEESFDHLFGALYMFGFGAYL